MQRRKKQLLGIVGLLIVGVLTAVACIIPEAASAAVEDEGYSVGTDVRVTVLSNAPALSASSPKDNSQTSSPIVHVAYRYEKMSEIVTSLEYKNESGNIVRSVVNTFVPENQEFGDNSFDIDLTTYGLKDREYKLIIVGQGTNGTTREDTILFNYRAVIVDPQPPVDPEDPTDPTDPTDPEKPEVSDPIIDIEISEEVVDVLIHVYYDNSERPAFVDEDGKEVTIMVDRNDINPETGKISVKLPFSEYNVPYGWYMVSIIGRDQNGKVVSMVTTRVWYGKGTGTTPTNPTDPTNPTTPETPNTGSLLGDLNITRVDYLITGLVVFAAVAGFALYLINRKSRR